MVATEDDEADQNGYAKHVSKLDLMPLVHVLVHGSIHEDRKAAATVLSGMSLYPRVQDSFAAADQIVPMLKLITRLHDQAMGPDAQANPAPARRANDSDAGNADAGNDNGADNGGNARDDNARDGSDEYSAGHDDNTNNNNSNGGGGDGDDDYIQVGDGGGGGGEVVPGGGEGEVLLLTLALTCVANVALQPAHHDKLDQAGVVACAQHIIATSSDAYLQHQAARALVYAP